MKEIKNAMPVINTLLTPNDKLLFNLFYLIAESPSAFWATDNTSYLIGQTNEKLPMWVWLSESVSKESYAEIETVLLERLKRNPQLKLTADAKRVKAFLQSFSSKHGFHFKSQVPMIVYSCNKVTNSKKADGHMIFSTQEHRQTLADFITGMVDDLEHRPMRDGESEGFANDVAGSQNMYLWEDNGTVTSMAMIVHRTNEFARINTVYTDKKQRGKGYAGMLVGEVTQKLLDENLLPMLYTEKDNVCSNATYKRIGYHSCGELTTFLFG